MDIQENIVNVKYLKNKFPDRTVKKPRQSAVNEKSAGKSDSDLHPSIVVSIQDAQGQLAGVRAEEIGQEKLSFTVEQDWATLPQSVQSEANSLLQKTEKTLTSTVHDQEKTFVIVSVPHHYWLNMTYLYSRAGYLEVVAELGNNDGSPRKATMQIASIVDPECKLAKRVFTQFYSCGRTGKR